jgi:uroporphyrin-III C-methyltransferase
VEVINGISSGLAAPSSLGIPLTHRDWSQGAIFVTGHGKSPESNPDWTTLAKLDLTLVIYMGIARCNEIQEALIAGGKLASTLVAVIQSATAVSQAQIVTTLGQLPVALAASQLGSPSIIVIGDVVRYADNMDFNMLSQQCAAV